MTHQEREARDAVMEAAYRYAAARGGAQWTNGYRCASENPDEVWQKERRQWAAAEIELRRLKTALTRYAKAVRAAALTRKALTRG